MSQYRVSRSATIKGRRAQVYAVIADYRQHHPRIAPPKYFRKVEVLEGGVGAGTRTRVEMRVLGTTRVFEQVVTEPEPGRVLLETDSDGLSSTTFTVDEGATPESARVTITTDVTARPGISGFLERLFTSVMLRRIYRMELAQLAAYMAERPTAR